MFRLASVRLRLLIMALLPLIVLMPLLLFLGMSRWSRDYDELLIANVGAPRAGPSLPERSKGGTGRQSTSSRPRICARSRPIWPSGHASS